MPFFMASTDSQKETIMAHSMGWRTFRVKGANMANLANEIDCPNASTGVQCRDCTLCDGLGVHGKGKSITAVVHGTTGKINKFNLVNI